MKKFLSVLLSLLLLCQPIVFAETVTENVALNKAAFSYSSVDGTDPSLAIDGDYDTEWISAGAGSLSDNFVIDLGVGCAVSSVELIAAEGASVADITIYGAYDAESTTMSAVTLCANLTGEASKDYKDLIKKQIGTTASDAEDMVTVDTSSETDNFRYIILKQAANSGIPMGFAEVNVYGVPTGDAVVGTVTELSSSSTGYSFAGHTGGNVIGGGSDADNLKDSNPSTGITKWGNSTASKDGITALMDLGEGALPVTHVAYQTKSYDAYASTSTNANKYRRSFSDFQIVGSNDGTTFTELGYVGVGPASCMTADDDTGLWIIPVDTNDTSYRYIGLRKIGSSYGATIYWTIHTLKAYASIASIEEIVAATGKDYILKSESSVVGESELSYEASILNGSKSGDVLGLFVGKNSSGAIVTAAQEGAIPLRGANNTLTLSAELPDGVKASDYTWSMAVVHKATMSVMDYLSDVKALARPTYADRTGEDGTVSYSRVVNELKLSGSADADIVGMIILKPDCDFDTFAAEDIFAFDVRTPDSTGAYTLSNPMQGAEPGVYSVGLFANTSTFEGIDALTHEIVDVEEVAAVFDSATADTLMDIFTDEEYEAIQSLFDSELVASLVAAEEASGTVGKSFLLAKEGFEEGVFADSEGWSDMDIISKAIQTALLVDNTLSGADIADSVAKYGDTMPLIFEAENNKKYYNADEFEEILPSVLSKINPDSAADLATAYKRAIALCLIADGELIDRKTALEIYADELGIDEDTLKTSHTLRAIADELSSSMSTVKTSYAGGMDGVIDDIIDALDSTSSGSGNSSSGSGNSSGGGGGGVLGGGKTGVKAETPAYIAPAVPAPVETEQNSAAASEVVFTDIADYVWAKDAIELLAGRRIMEGPGDGSFNPSGLLTREQAVKLLVLTLNMDTNQNTNSFKDLQYGAWYYPYITSAKMSGLVTGISRTEFGLGQLVTRQDLAVMIYRALDARKLAANGEGTAFADDAYVADYAKEAVASLSSMKLITGYTDGRFGPVDTATRAEAAAVFARLLEIVENADKEAAQ